MKQNNFFLAIDERPIFHCYAAVNKLLFVVSMLSFCKLSLYSFGYIQYFTINICKSCLLLKRKLLLGFFSKTLVVQILFSSETTSILNMYILFMCMCVCF